MYLATPALSVGVGRSFGAVKTQGHRVNKSILHTRIAIRTCLVVHELDPQFFDIGTT